MADYRDDIEKYRKDELTSAEMHALEKKALTDPFLADALEGAESISSHDFSVDLLEIDQKILSKRNKSVWFTPLRIAAGIILVIGSAFLIYTFNQTDEQLSLQKEEAPAPTKGSTDSITNKNEQGFLSLNQPKEETKTEAEADRKEETSPTLAKADGSGETKPTADLSTSAQGAPVVADEEAEADQAVAAEIVTEEKIAAAEPVQQELKKEAVNKDIVSRAKAKRSAIADDTPQRMVRGQVTSSEDGLPLPGVNVNVKGTTTGTVTDLQGNYSILLENEKQQLVFSFIGLRESEVSLSDKSSVDVKLLEDGSPPSEVVIMGSLKSNWDDTKTPVLKLAEPAGGRKAYDNYLKNNLRYPEQALENKIKGGVTINFIVEMNGKLLAFSVIESLGYGCDEEVIRLVKQGPKWYPSSENNVAMESTVTVRLQFDPEKVQK